ncbi:MAG: HD domain-containing phosphohydrolase [Spirochaetota bacterium]
MNNAVSSYKAVVISKDLKDWVHVPENLPFTLLFAHDIEQETKKLVQASQDQRLELIFFLPTEGIPRILPILRDLLNESILFTIVAISAGGNPPPAEALSPEIIELRTSVISKDEFYFLIRKAFLNLEDVFTKKEQEKERLTKLIDAWNDQEALINIGKSLSLEKDPDKLLRKILYLSKKITGADAGSIFITEEGVEGKRLRFKYSHTFSMELDYEEFTLPLNTSSIAGYVAVTGKVLNIPDVYKLEKNAPVVFNPTFDREHGYRTQSMLVVPMRNHMDKIIGVIQLINSKESVGVFTGNEAFEIHLDTPEDFEKKVIPFESRYEGLMEAVAGQAAIAMENNRMLIQIEHQFEEFVKASVSAIESRDPATSGHSFRVANMCVNMAKAISRSTEEPFAGIRYSPAQLKEIEFAALLHDFGKVYIDPSIFLKARKLFPRDFEYLMLRLRFLYRSLELDYALRLQRASGAELKPLLEEKEKRLKTVRDIIERVTQLNEPTVQSGDPDIIINSILALERELKCVDIEGNTIPILTETEIENLKIRKGSLNTGERREIESHVEHTYGFVSKIPWPDEYENIPDITRKHHEKLDGSGYPHGLRGKEVIPLPARIMAIADIFDALNAPDRPYKKGVPLDRVFSILREEAAQGKLDPDLVELFLRERVWERTG